MRLGDLDRLAEDIEMAVEDAPLHVQATVQQYIDCAPAIDPIRAAGGCRCVECKHAIYRHWANKYECKKVQGLMNFSDHFCGYGEPEEAKDDG